MKNSQSYLACAASGLLLGLSVPSFAFLPLGFLAWAWLVPLLFELKKTSAFVPFVARALVAVVVGFSIITLYVVNASAIGFLASTAMGVFVWAIPFIWLYFARRFSNWRTALFSLPFFWTAWEWIYHQTEISFGAVRLGYTQAEMLWLIQFADITGVDGATFWLVAINVALFRFLERRLDQPGAVKISRATFSGIDFAPLILLFALPLAYSAFVFFKPQPTEREIEILAVQPNVSPFLEWTPKTMAGVFGKQLALTNAAIKRHAPDLIVWHEIAVPYVLSENRAANNYLAKQIAKWNAPVLTGLIETKHRRDDETPPLLLAAQNRRQEFFNSAALFEPVAARDGGALPIDLSAMYLKRRLMPFVERAPFADRFPAINDFLIPIGVRPRMIPGETIKTFEFAAKDGAAVRVGAMICYENLYPEMSADLARGGAQILTAITNEGFFAHSQAQYQLAAFARFRSIETRRALVRAAATGMTRATDRFGRVTAEVPMHSEQTLTVRVRLSDEQTVYTRSHNFFAIACAFSVLLLTCAAIWLAIRRTLGRSRK